MLRILQVINIFLTEYIYNIHNNIYNNNIYNNIIYIIIT